MARARLIASGIFVVGYLAFQLVYPLLPYIRPGFDKFTWHMYAGRRDAPEFTVVFADGRQETLPHLLERSSRIRLVGPSVDRRQVVPPYLCRRWADAREVRVRDRRQGGTEIVPCATAR